MKLVNLSIKRRVAMSMLYLIIVGFGLFSLSQLKIDLYPEMDLPIVAIFTEYSGVGPEDMENLVTRPLEETVSATKNVKTVHSQSSLGSSIVMLEFEWGSDMDQAEIDVRNRIDLVRDFLPQDAGSPMVIAFDPSMQPVLIMSLHSNQLGPAELREIAEDKFEPMLERVNGVASVTTKGGLERRINVNIDPMRLAAHNLSIDAVANAVRGGAGLLPAGRIDTHTKHYNLRVFSEYLDLEQIRNTVVSVRGGKTVHLKDVADVIDGDKEETSDVRADYGQGVVVLIQKQSDANTVQAVKNVKETLPDVLALAPEGIEFSLLFDQSDFIQRSISNLSNTAVIALLLAFVVIYVFLMNWRGSIIMGLSMPISVIVTFAVMMATGLTLNMISMAGLALAIGMLVDNSVVVLENIFRHKAMGKSLYESADKGTSEVGAAIVASTLTTVSVFLPVLFVPGITGQLFRDMVITITFSLCVSLFIALTLVPLLSTVLLKEKEEKNSNKLTRYFEKSFERLSSWYERSLKAALSNRRKVMIGVLVLFVLSIGTTKFIGGEFMPETDEGFISLEIEMAPGSTLESLRKQVLELEKMIRKEVPEVQALQFEMGAEEGFRAMQTGQNKINMTIRLTSQKDRSRTQFDIQDALRERLDEFAGFTYNFKSGGFSGEKAIEVKIFGNDIEAGKLYAEQLKEKLTSRKGFVDLDLNMKDSSPELRVHLKQDVINDLHLSSMQIASIVSTSMQGRTVARYREGGDEYDIYVQFAEKYRKDREALEELLIPLPTGTLVQLGQVAVIEEEASPTTIFRENQERFVSLGISLFKKDLSSAVKEIKSIVAEFPLPDDDMTIIYGGSAEDQQESFKYLLIAFLAAIVLVYMIMAAQFESLMDPLIIMFTVPLSIIGVFGALLVSGTPISVMALVGLVMLVGIAVNNGIVLVDYINQLRERGESLYEAVMVGGVARMRPVLMTAFTTIFGMVPLAFEMGEGSETWAPLARAVIGGLLTTTFLTLFVIPILYIWFERFRKQKSAN